MQTSNSSKKYQNRSINKSLWEHKWEVLLIMIAFIMEGFTKVLDKYL